MGEYDPLTNYAVYVYTVYMANNFGSKCWSLCSYKAISYSWVYCTYQTWTKPIRRKNYAFFKGVYFDAVVVFGAWTDISFLRGDVPNTFKLIISE